MIFGKGIKFDTICMKMMLMKNKKNICSKNFHERYLHSKLQPILRRQQELCPFFM